MPLVEHATQLDGERLASRQRHRHVGDEPADVAREATIGGVAAFECISMVEICPPDRILARLNVAAPIARLRRFRCARLVLSRLALALAHARVDAAPLHSGNRCLGHLADDAARLSRCRLGLDTEPAQLAREALLCMMSMIRML